MTHEHDEKHDEKDDASSEGGQVSELAVAGGEPDPISAGDSAAGQPDDESGDVQEGAQGPNAIPDDETDEHPHEHGTDCGHPSVPHADHVDYVHDGHRHAVHGEHYDEH